MRKGTTKILAIVISAVMLVGCGEEKNEKQTSAALHDEDNVYQETRISKVIKYCLR